MKDAEGRNAWPWRDLQLSTDYWVFYQEDTEERREAAVAQIEEYKALMEGFWREDHGMSESWLATNPLERDSATIENKWRDYYPSGDFFARLQAVKDHVDPHNVFRNAMTIPPTSEFSKQLRSFVFNS